MKKAKKEKKPTKFSHLTYSNRLKIERMNNEGYGIQAIADALHVHYTTVYRELKRKNVTYQHKKSDWTYEERYSADKAQEQYEMNKTAKGRPIKLGKDFALADFIERKIADEHYSPAAIIMEIREKGLVFDTTICEKTIYNYVNSGNVFLRVTSKHLPERGRRKRKYNHVRPARDQKGDNIEQRPEHINQREEPGHWEMDTVKGKQKTKKCVLTMSERKTRNEIALPIMGAKMENVVAQLDALERRLGDRFPVAFKSITVDNGSEFQDCAGIERSIFGGKRTKVYYCHPYSSYERGTNENLNKMLRRIFPKGTDFDLVPDDEIIAAAGWMNNYPRKVLGGTTAAHAFDNFLAEIS